jgi:2-polyprenyl-3-methyl-5-hydroxy-6-metoxy-1,4-benzoquinol methylase
MKTDAADTPMNLYDEKDTEYFARARSEIRPLLANGTGKSLRGLEIGCSQGHTLEWLKQTGHCSWVAGVEPYAEIHESVRSIDQFFKLDIEKGLPDIPPESIDLILCLDVLEHLINPWETIRRLDGLLKPGGQLIVSLPNIRNYHVVLDLAFKGKFSYSDSGILDRTHLRFFTRSSAIQLTESAGAIVTHVIRSDTQRWQKRLLSTLGLGDFLAKQFLLSATKSLDL